VFAGVGTFLLAELGWPRKPLLFRPPSPRVDSFSAVPWPYRVLADLDTPLFVPGSARFPPLGVSSAVIMLLLSLVLVVFLT